MENFDLQAYWDAVLRQDAQAMETFLAPNAIVNWHCTNESFTAAEFVRANCEDPGQWEGEIQRVEPIPGRNRGGRPCLFGGSCVVFPCSGLCSFDGREDHPAGRVLGR